MCGGVSCALVRSLHSGHYGDKDVFWDIFECTLTMLDHLCVLIGSFMKPYKDTGGRSCPGRSAPLCLHSRRLGGLGETPLLLHHQATTPVLGYLFTGCWPGDWWPWSIPILPLYGFLHSGVGGAGLGVGGAGLGVGGVGLYTGICIKSNLLGRRECVCLCVCA